MEIGDRLYLKQQLIEIVGAEKGEHDTIWLISHVIMSPTGGQHLMYAFRMTGRELALNLATGNASL